MLLYVKAVTDYFDISPSRTNVGFIVFSNYARIAFPFNADYTRAGVRQLIDGVQQSDTREQRIDRALQMAYRDLFSTRYGARAGARQVKTIMSFPLPLPTRLLFTSTVTL